MEGFSPKEFECIKKASEALRCPPCPECGSMNTKVYSWNIRARQKVRRYRCQVCYRTFTEPKEKPVD